MLKLLLLFIALLIIWVIKIAKEPSKEQREFAEYLDARHAEDNQDATFSCTAGSYDIYIMPSKKLISISNNYHYRRVGFEDILKIIPFEFTNNESQNGSALGGAAVGGLLAGGVGAIVGATAGAKERNYNRVRKLGFVMELYIEEIDKVERYEIIILKDSTNSVEIRRAYDVYDSLVLEFKTYFTDKIVA